jgi:hypothetical protein
MEKKRHKRHFRNRLHLRKEARPASNLPSKMFLLGQHGCARAGAGTLVLPVFVGRVEERRRRPPGASGGPAERVLRGRRFREALPPSA